MRAKEIMTANPRCVSATDKVGMVAQIMRDADCGSVPVVDDAGKVVGIITDRDLAVRVLARDERGSDTQVMDVMTGYPYSARPDDDLRHVEKVMVERQVRRVPVVDVDGRCVGIISQGDIARAAMAKPDVVSDREVALVVERISSPAPRKSDPRFAETVRISTENVRISTSTELRPDAPLG
jgi:CBS domain-containing protein